MPYIVNFTDRDNKSPITVFDNTSNVDTSLTFPGRNVTGYGQIIAENFLKLLENFASADQPVNPVEGQLWYDTQSGLLQLYDNINWRAASGIQKGITEPPVETSNVGELWVDTTNQQLRIFTGSRWLLVGPRESSVDGLRYGPVVENLEDLDGESQTVVILYLSDIPTVIFSKNTFVPKQSLAGFENIQSGINIITPRNPTEEQDFANIFLGGSLPKLIGTASFAEGLKVGTNEVPSSRFLRTDVTNTIDFPLNIRNNAGINLGADGNFIVSTTSTSGRIYNSLPGSSIDIQTNRNGISSTIVRVNDNKVGINNTSPQYELDVIGTINVSEQLRVSNAEASSNLNNGSTVINGGVAINKNLIVGTTIEAQGTSNLSNTLPRSDKNFDLGASTRKWRTVYAETISANILTGLDGGNITINANITGNSNTATNLKQVTTFRLDGDVTSNVISFDGQLGSFEKVFNCTLDASLIASKEEPAPNFSDDNDFILTYRVSEASRASGGLLRQRKSVFIGDSAVPIGSILPFAGSDVAIPRGYLLCDGSEVEIAKYRDLYDTIGTRFNGDIPLVGLNTFRLPDLRGRMVLGKQNMDNGELVPLFGSSVGTYVDGGGGSLTTPRVGGTAPNNLGATSGQSAVVLQEENLPDHRHTLQNTNGRQFSVVRLDSAAEPNAVTGPGPTSTGQAQYLNNSGGVVQSPGSALSTPLEVMNPYITLNYIIRSGPAAFETRV